LVRNDGELQAQVTKDTPARFDYAVWFGNRFTSSCILWPGLYEWARKQLRADQLIACCPQARVMCVSARGDVNHRSAIRNYLDTVGNGMDKLISTDWFELTAGGVFPMSSD
jgi:hypothetical protein